MTSADPTAIIILSEIVFIETIAIIGFFIYILISKIKMIKLFKKKLDGFKKNIPDRKSSLKSLYSKISHIQEKDLEVIIDDLIDKESQFYTSTIDAFSKNDLSFIKNFDEKIYTLVKSYSQFIPQDRSPIVNEDEASTIIPNVDTAIDELLAEDKNDENGDPALDLSESMSTESADNEMAEIPEELLSGNKNTVTKNIDSNNGGQTLTDKVNADTIKDDRDSTEGNQ